MLNLRFFSFLIEENVYCLSLENIDTHECNELGRYSTILVEDLAHVSKGTQLTPGTINYSSLFGILDEKNIKLLLLEKIKLIYSRWNK